jgi:hypothetical protein
LISSQSHIFSCCLCVKNSSQSTERGSDIQIFHEVIGTWSRLLLCSLYASCPLVQEPIILTLISLLRSCCGGPSSLLSLSNFGIIRSQCLARTYRCLLLLASTLSRSTHVDRLLREVHETLNKAQHGSNETDIGVFLQWVAVSGKLSQNDSNLCSTLYSNALSHLTLLPNNSEAIPDSIFETKYQQLYGRSLSVISGLNQKNVVTIFSAAHLSRVFNSERQTVFLDKTFTDLKLLLR